jgi:hypothetical protein
MGLSLRFLTQSCPCGGVVPRGRQVKKGAHAWRRDRVFVPERCSAPQDGDTPLHFAASYGNAASVPKLLTAKAAKAATNRVRGKGG